MTLVTEGLELAEGDRDRGSLLCMNCPVGEPVYPGAQVNNGCSGHMGTAWNEANPVTSRHGMRKPGTIVWAKEID
jgi:hypothetical protein